MKSINEKELIISLIKDNLISTRLISGLAALGLDPIHYDLHLSTTIFILMGIKDDNEELFEEYMELCKQVMQLDFFEYPELLDSHAEGIYVRLTVKSNKKHLEF